MELNSKPGADKTFALQQYSKTHVYCQLIHKQAFCQQDDVPDHISLHRHCVSRAMCLMLSSQVPAVSAGPYA